TLMSLGRKHGRSDCWAGRVLQKAEGVIEGMLIMQGVKLEMDRYVEREPSGSQASQFAGRAGN
ncbi:antitermination protein, partial [Escherichia coli]